MLRGSGNTRIWVAVLALHTCWTETGCCILCPDKWEIFFSKTISSTTHSSSNIVMVSFYHSEWQCKFLPVWKCNVEATCFNLSEQKLPTISASQPRGIYLTHLLSHHLVNYHHFVNSVAEWRQPSSTVKIDKRHKGARPGSSAESLSLQWCHWNTQISDKNLNQSQLQKQPPNFSCYKYQECFLQPALEQNSIFANCCFHLKELLLEVFSCPWLFG